MIDAFIHIRKNLFSIVLLSLFVYLSLYLSLEGNSNAVLMLGLIPMAILITVSFVKWPKYLLGIVFVINYIIMGLGRYMHIPIPVTILFELLFALTFVCMIFRIFNDKIILKDGINFYWFFGIIWFLYGLINAGNGVTGEIRLTEWYKQFRPICAYPLLVTILVSLHAKRYTFIHKFMILWGILTILGAFKGYWQRIHGFDHGEWAWLLAGGMKTHFINSGVRYFSFFTDAANFGCSMGFSLMVFGIASIYTKNLPLRVFFLIVSLAGGYGMLISGTRAALAVPIAGIAMYTVLCKNWKIFLVSGVSLVLGIFILAFTTIGDGSPLIRRMRSAFDKDDASMNVRYINQKAIKAYMSEAPFGIGMGLSGSNVSNKNKFYIVADTPPDSDFVNIWIHEGEVGLTLYLLLQAIVMAVGSYYVVFRIKSDELRGVLTGMLCGSSGLLTASYANMIYFQFPNGIIVYTCMTMVFLGPVFDKQFLADHATGKKEGPTLENKALKNETASA